jgi:hypothetical protein
MCQSKEEAAKNQQRTTLLGTRKGKNIVIWQILKRIAYLKNLFTV